MAESTTHKMARRKRYVTLGIILIVGGIIMGALTAVTVFGPILGILIAILGGFMIWSSGRKGAPMPEPGAEAKPPHR